MIEDVRLRLQPGEAAARVSMLSPIKSRALLACLVGERLWRERGHWRSTATEKIISGVTVADLVRDEFMVTYQQDKVHSFARLTTRGKWFARTLAGQPGARASLGILPAATSDVAAAAVSLGA